MKKEENRMKKILFCLFIMLSGIYACSDDIENQIEGQWQLKTMEENGVISKVDTVFYSFMSGRVFSYTILLNQDETCLYYGYIDALSDKEILIKIDDEYFLNKSRDFEVKSDWEEQQRIFEIQSINSKKLVLFYGGKTYSFRKH
jgi:hypothetical protein